MLSLVYIPCSCASAQFSPVKPSDTDKYSPYHPLNSYTLLHYDRVWSHYTHLREGERERERGREGEREGGREGEGERERGEERKGGAKEGGGKGGSQCIASKTYRADVTNHN